MTSFINHIIDKMIEHDSFSLDILVKESMAYMNPILLEEESVSVDYILFDTAYDNLQYSKFGMPASLMQDKSHNLIKIKSNNPPMSKYQLNYTINECDVKEIDKFLFFSDGIIENTTSDNMRTYADYIEDDFKHSFTREDLKTKFFSKIDEAEDDITLIFINRIPFEDVVSYKESFTTSLADVDKASEWYEKLWSSLSDNTEVSYKAGVVFTELYMNAYEHGNLGIDSATKHKLLDDDIYFETLQEKEMSCNKKIDVKVSKLSYNSSNYVITQISDEGEGFDTQILSEIFRNSKTFNGRGVFVSRSNSLGIYYNSKGTTVLYLHKV